MITVAIVYCKFRLIPSIHTKPISLFGGELMLTFKPGTAYRANHFLPL